MCVVLIAFCPFLHCQIGAFCHLFNKAFIYTYVCAATILRLFETRRHSLTVLHIHRSILILVSMQSNEHITQYYYTVSQKKRTNFKTV